MIRVKEAIVVEGKYDKIKRLFAGGGVLIIEVGASACSRTGKSRSTCGPWPRPGASSS